MRSNPVRWVHATASIVFALGVGLVLTGCSPSDIVFVDSGVDYNAQDVATAADPDREPDALGNPTSAAIDLRHDALVDLRAMGEQQALLADLLTDKFPGDSRAVPYHAESASFEQQDAWIVFEVFGAEGDTLQHRRVWVFERESGRVLFTGSVN